MENFIVVLFKNKLKKKIIKKFITYKKAKNFFQNLIKKSDNVIFSKQFENAKECKYELGLVEMSNKQLFPIYMTDEMGRNVKVKLQDDNKTLVEVIPYNIEEKIYDVQKNKKIETEQLINDYLKGDGIKMVSSLNNKIVVQKNEKVYLFSVKNQSESNRLLDCLSKHFFKIRRSDCIFVKDYSSAQRKYLFSLLEEKGFDKKVLYRQFTTYPRSK
jgi:hypothetical protein